MHTQTAKYQFCVSLIAYILNKTHYLLFSVHHECEKLILDSIHVTKNNFALLFYPNIEKKIKMMKNSIKLKEYLLLLDRGAYNSNVTLVYVGYLGGSVS